MTNDPPTRYYCSRCRRVLRNDESKHRPNQDTISGDVRGKGTVRVVHDNCGGGHVILSYRQVCGYKP